MPAVVNNSERLEYVLCCDSADLYAWILQNTDHSYSRNNDYTRSVDMMIRDSNVRLTFVHRASTKKMYDSYTHNFLKNTAGTPDYILLDDKMEPLICIEDSKTAPVGNAVIQRMDKIFPLLLDDNIKCRVLYIGPKQGLDKSNNTMRSWPQSWFYKSFAKNREDSFMLLEPGESICTHVLGQIKHSIEQHMMGHTIQKQAVTREELLVLHNSMVKNIRTYSGSTFNGKLFKPNGADAHPIQSTLMMISETRNALRLTPIRIETKKDHKERLLKSSAKRLCKIKERQPVIV